MLYPTERIQQLHFGVATPFETVLDRRIQPGSRVLLPEIAALVRRDMLGVVQNGTGRRAHDGIKLPDGTVLPIGGKTGTGDNEFHIYAKNGGYLATHTVNRTAAFTFFIGDRFFGTVLAFVPGKQASSYDFTSALAVEILKDLTPSFLPAIQSSEPQHFTAAPPAATSRLTLATSQPARQPLARISHQTGLAHAVMPANFAVERALAQCHLLCNVKQGIQPKARFSGSPTLPLSCWPAKPALGICVWGMWRLCPRPLGDRIGGGTGWAVFLVPPSLAPAGIPPPTRPHQ